MFHKAKKEITILGKTEPIIGFDVWFMTPFGLTDDYESAVKRLVADDMDVELCLKPVAVAITETNYEVIG